MNHLKENYYRTDFELEGSSNYAFPLVLKKANYKNRDLLEKIMKINNIEFRRGNAGGGNQLRQPYLKKYIKGIKNKGSVLYLSPQGKPLTQQKLKNLSLKDNLTILCGRYEGVDQRVIDNLVDEELSIGDYVISGGESASMVLMEGITRLIPGVVDDIESIKQDSFQAGILDHPHYTKPENIKGMAIPDVLVSGNHQKIEIWRRKHALGATWLKRPELLKNVKLSKEDDKLLKEYILEHKQNEQK